MNTPPATIPSIFKNKTVYIIGGGPSLKGFDFKQLENKNVIAVNRAIEYCNPDVLYWSDERFYRWFKFAIDNFKGLKVTNKVNPKDPSIINLKDTGRAGLELDPTKLKNGNNSGYAAINLAVHLGASEIILLGYDMGYVNNETHFHTGYDNVKADPTLYKRNMIPYFDTLVKPLRDLNIKIWNANPNSNLKCFPFKNIK